MHCDHCQPRPGTERRGLTPGACRAGVICCTPRIGLTRYGVFWLEGLPPDPEPRSKFPFSVTFNNNQNKTGGVVVEGCGNISLVSWNFSINILARICTLQRNLHKNFIFLHLFKFFIFFALNIFGLSMLPPTFSYPSLEFDKNHQAPNHLVAMIQIRAV